MPSRLALHASFIIICVFAFTKGLTDVEHFHDWFKKNSGICNGIEVNYFQEMGRGFEAKESISEGQLLLKIPKKLQLSYSNMKIASDPNLRDLAQSIKSPEVALAFWILQEKYLGENSEMAEYINILPTHIPSLLLFTEQDLQLLEDSSLRGVATAFQLETLNNYEKAIDTLSKDSKTVLLSKISFKDFIWAMSIINSRGLRFQGEVILAPMADIFNYRFHPEVRLANNGNFFLKHHYLDTNGDLCVLADRDFNATQQVFEDYGDNPNEIYLQYHGFVPDVNPFDCVKIGGKPLTNFETSEFKTEILKSLGFKKSPVVCVDRGGKLSKPFEAFLAVIAMSDAQAIRCLSAIKAPSSWDKVSDICQFNAMGHVVEHLRTSSEKGIYFTGIVEENQFDLNFIEIVKSFLLSELSVNKFSTSIDEDIDLLNKLSLKEPDTISNSALSIRFRLKRKELISSIAEVYNLNLSFVTKSNDQPSLDQKIKYFNEWFLSNNPKVCKIEAAIIPGFRIGTLTTADVFDEDVYLTVPNNVIIDSNKGYESSSVSSLLQNLEAKFKTRDDFHELLFYLINEYYVEKEESIYWPYLALLPTINDMSIPLLWSDEDINSKLFPSFVRSNIRMYRERTNRRYNFIKNITEVAGFFPRQIFNLETYLWGTAILDSRSIWWDGKRHLVPMLDFVNCAENNERIDRIHSTSMDSISKSAITLSGKEIRGNYLTGSQLFENYGQPNHIYFVYHGFVLDSNSYDCVQFDFELEEKDILIAKNQFAARYLEQQGVSIKSKVFSTCLKWPLSQQIWSVFNLLELESIPSDVAVKLNGSPSQSATLRIKTAIEKQLKLYDEPCSRGHESIALFLCTEERMLNLILTALRE